MISRGNDGSTLLAPQNSDAEMMSKKNRGTLPPVFTVILAPILSWNQSTVVRICQGSRRTQEMENNCFRLQVFVLFSIEFFTERSDLGTKGTSEVSEWKGESVSTLAVSNCRSTVGPRYQSHSIRSFPFGPRQFRRFQLERYVSGSWTHGRCGFPESQTRRHFHMYVREKCWPNAYSDTQQLIEKFSDHLCWWNGL